MELTPPKSLEITFDIFQQPGPLLGFGLLVVLRHPWPKQFLKF